MPQRAPERVRSLRSIRSSDQIRVGIFNVKYSPNLGDGLLTECLEAELVRAAPRLAVEAFDLAGRTDYRSGGRFRGALLNLLQSSPTLIRQAAATAILGRSLQRLIPAWRQSLRTIDVAVTGGGNLFSDADLNYPLKIDAAWGLLRELDIPVAVFAVGVSDNWTERGAALFRRAFTGTRMLEATVRDARSAEVWNRRIGLPVARVVHDPGFLVAWNVPQVRPPGGNAPRVGIGLTHPTTLRYHADEGIVSEADLTTWYIELVRRGVAAGWNVCVFTNGSSEDEIYFRKIRPALAAIAPTVSGGAGLSFARRFTRPDELARYISGLDLLLAHRLHSNIAAYSYRVPQIGFTWDAKLTSFFALVQRGEYLCTAGRDAPETVLALAQRCLREGIDRKLHGQILESARTDVGALAAVLVRGAGVDGASTPGSHRP